MYDEPMECIRLPVKPLSQNDAWKMNKKGYMYKTAEYYAYQEEILKFLELKPLHIPEGQLLIFKANFGTAYIDLDNCEKPFIDILEKAYGFNDSTIHEIHVKKHKVGKGLEYIEFAFYPLEDFLPMDFVNSPRSTYKILTMN